VQTNERLLKKAEEYREKFGATVHMLTAAALEISSSEIRARKARGERWKEMLTDDVASYIEQRGLYE
jgi:nicotinic acid mononucleotide adenylyltransferase